MVKRRTACPALSPWRRIEGERHSDELCLSRKLLCLSALKVLIELPTEI